MVLLSCHDNDRNSGKKVFHINYSSGNLEAIDPAFAKDLYQIWTCHMVYNTLVETDENLRIVPSLAKSWETTDSGTGIVFHLRTDVYFQDNDAFPNGKGRKFVAGDVVYSFNRIVDPATASTGSWIFNGHISKNAPFTAINDSTFLLRLSRPFRPMLGALSMAYCNIVPSEVVKKWGKDYRSHPCGTGPFCFNYWEEGSSLSLLKNTHYWERDETSKELPDLDAVQISFADSKATEYLLFRQHKLDFINGIDGSFKDVLLSKKGELKTEFVSQFKMLKGTYLNTEYIGMLTDTLNAVLNNAATRSVLVRQAINYAINRGKLVTYYKNGVGIPAEGGFIPAGIAGYTNGSGIGYHYDPEKARQLLIAAGHPGGAGLNTLEILVPDHMADIVNFIVGELKEVGIPAKIATIQPNILKEQMSRSQAIVFRANWLADYPDAETFLVVFNGSQPAPPNYTRFKNDTFDSWYTQSLNLPDSIRWRTYSRMDSLAMSYAPVIPLYYDMRLHFVQNNVSGFRSNAMNTIDLKHVILR